MFMFSLPPPANTSKWLYHMHAAVVSLINLFSVWFAFSRRMSNLPHSRWGQWWDCITVCFVTLRYWPAGQVIWWFPTRFTAHSETESHTTFIRLERDSHKAHPIAWRITRFIQRQRNSPMRRWNLRNQFLFIKPQRHPAERSWFIC